MEFTNHADPITVDRYVFEDALSTLDRLIGQLIAAADAIDERSCALYRQGSMSEQYSDRMSGLAQRATSAGEIIAGAGQMQSATAVAKMQRAARQLEAELRSNG